VHSDIVLGRLGPDAVARGAATLPVARFLATAVPPARPLVQSQVQPQAEAQGAIPLERPDPVADFG
jgi:hypothetical protein